MEENNNNNNFNEYEKVELQPVPNEFDLSNHDTREDEYKTSHYLIYAVVFALVLIISGIAGSYAYYKTNSNTTTTPTNITATTECINISYGETGSVDLNDGAIGLDKDYPISDSYASTNVVPVTVNITNNCSRNSANINYTLAITSLANASGYIQDNQIRYSVKRKLGNEAETTFKNASYLNSLTPLSSGSVLDYLNQDLANRPGFDAYSNKTTYVIDNGSVGNNKVNTYKIYLWVDYYEGDSAMYTTPGATHNSSYDNSTQGKNFKAAISLVVNP